MVGGVLFTLDDECFFIEEMPQKLIKPRLIIFYFEMQSRQWNMDSVLPPLFFLTFNVSFKTHLTSDLTTQFYAFCTKKRKKKYGSVEGGK